MQFQFQLKTFKNELKLSIECEEIIALMLSKMSMYCALVISIEVSMLFLSVVQFSCAVGVTLP